MDSALLLAQVGFGSLSILHWILIAIVVAGGVAILFVILNQLGVKVPPFIITICWILLAVFVGVIAIKLLASMIGTI